MGEGGRGWDGLPLRYPEWIELLHGVDNQIHLPLRHSKRKPCLFSTYSVAVFLVPVVEAGYGIGLSYRPAKLHMLAGWYDIADFISLSGTKNWASGVVYYPSNRLLHEDLHKFLKSHHHVERINGRGPRYFCSRLIWLQHPLPLSSITTPSLSLSLSFFFLCSSYNLPNQADGRGERRKAKTTAKKGGLLLSFFLNGPLLTSMLCWVIS